MPNGLDELVQPLSRGIRYPSPLWGLIPLGLEALTIYRRSRYPPTSSSLRAAHPYGYGLSFGGCTMCAKWVVHSRQTHKVEASASVVLLLLSPSAVRSLGAIKREEPRTSGRLRDSSNFDEVSSHRYVVSCTASIDTAAKIGTIFHI